MEDLIAQDNAEYEEGESVTKTIPILIKIIENVHAKNLAYQLVLPHIENRLCNKTLLRSLRSSMMTVILVESCGREKTQTRVSHQSSTHKTCGICARLANKKGREICVSCSRTLCAEHRKPLCSHCADLGI